MKKTLSIFLAAAVCSASIFAQSITTASDFFKSVSDYYETLEDYEVDLKITVGKTESSGRLSFKRPELLHLEFNNPEGQVINFDGSTLQVYVPGYAAILKQGVSGSSQGAQGLSLIRRYYTVAYETGQTPVPLEEGSSISVINLICYRRSNTETFRTIILSIDPQTKLIVRVVAVSQTDETFKLDFSNYAVNTHFSEQRFLYDPPSSANEYDNFLFED